MSSEPVYTSVTYDITDAVPIFAWEGLKSQHSGRNVTDPPSSITSLGINVKHIPPKHPVVEAAATQEVPRSVADPAPSSITSLGVTVKHSPLQEPVFASVTTQEAHIRTLQLSHEHGSEDKMVSQTHVNEELRVPHAETNVVTENAPGSLSITTRQRKCLKVERPFQFFELPGNGAMAAPPSAPELLLAADGDVAVYKLRGEDHHKVWVKEGGQWVPYASGQHSEMVSRLLDPYAFVVLWIPLHPKYGPRIGTCSTWIKRTTYVTYERSERRDSERRDKLQNESEE